ncbi:MAG TPA: alanine--tRNA ligase, partial [Chitinophagaceae bacterium]|nr:alanine--tRNA ligase [Chitinophagaceae bacterium]
PTLMFTNAGMNQFKDYFLGNKPAPYPRIADTQKCLRVSGKHNDLEEVGVDTYHHTMFEMLGNWSFGDYFKKEAIEWSWELLTTVLKIPKDRLYVTIFEGDEKEGLPKDDEAATEWKKWISEDRIVLGNKKDNFWEMGDTGPCGPCTEIHVDTRTAEERKRLDGQRLVNADHPQVIEIWNNVFIQYNRLKDGSLQQLPARHVDTGMGFERLVRVLQGKQSNYDTDIFSGTIEKIAGITGVKYNRSDTDKGDIAFRVLADHIRAIGFTIADGQLPSNTGAGYVIRRILRRAVRYYYSYLNYPQPLLFHLVPVIAKQFENVFPELKQQEDFVTKVIEEEEESFLRTISKGIARFVNYINPSTHSGMGGISAYPTDDAATKEGYINLQEEFLQERRKKIVAGKFAFELNDTYGFPIDLTELMAREQGWNVDLEGYNKALKQQKDRSRAATVIDTEDWIIVNEGNSNEFVGYETLETKAKLLRYRKIKSKGKEGWQVVLDKTPFYAESGGQVGDTGWFTVDAGTDDQVGRGSQLTVIDTKKENDLIIHVVEESPSQFSGDVIAAVDKEKRKRTALHHTATHLLHAALRTVFGKHVVQKGSLVNAEYLRFDFSHFTKTSAEEIGQVEKMVNEKIRENISVVIKEMPKAEAMQLGAMALFGEKYGETVRVVIMDPDYSVELCGGTHVGNTGELGLFKITSESAIAAGVRRIEAISGEAAEQYINDQLQQLLEVKEVFKNPKDLVKSVQSIFDENNRLKKEIEKWEQVRIKTLSTELLQKVQQINHVPFIGEIVEVNSADSLKKMALDLKAKLSSFVMILGANIENKAAVVLAFDERMVNEKGLDASKIVKQTVSPLIKGGGGGQKDFATAGGQDATALHQVIEAVKALI